jgi:hypothetical protein
MRLDAPERAETRRDAPRRAETRRDAPRRAETRRDARGDPRTRNDERLRSFTSYDMYVVAFTVVNSCPANPTPIVVTGEDSGLVDSVVYFVTVFLRELMNTSFFFRTDVFRGD